MYSEEDGSIIDGVHNAKEHARYIKSILNLADVEVTSIADFGFGKGILLREFVKEFKPEQILAIDPSKEAVVNLSRKKWLTKVKHKLRLKNFLNQKTQSLSTSGFVTLYFSI